MKPSTGHYLGVPINLHVKRHESFKMNITMCKYKTEDTTLLIHDTREIFTWDLSESPPRSWVTGNPVKGSTKLSGQANVHLHFYSDSLSPGTYIADLSISYRREVLAQPRQSKGKLPTATLLGWSANTITSNNIPAFICGRMRAVDSALDKELLTFTKA